MNRYWPTRVAAIAGFLAVALGAFGAHGLKNHLTQLGTTAIWEKAVLYHFIHAVMLFILAERPQLPKVAWWGFLGGIVFFSGSLYLLAITGIFWLGAITPIGGILFLIGWGCLILCRGSFSGGRGDNDGGLAGGRRDDH